MLLWACRWKVLRIQLLDCQSMSLIRLCGCLTNTVIKLWESDHFSSKLLKLDQCSYGVVGVQRCYYLNIKCSTLSESEVKNRVFYLKKWDLRRWTILIAITFLSHVSQTCCFFFFRALYIQIFISVLRGDPLEGPKFILKTLFKRKVFPKYFF